MPIKRQTYRLDQIDGWQGPIQQTGPTRDAAAERVRDRFARMSPTERVASELTERQPTPRAALPLRKDAQQPRPMPPSAGEMLLRPALGTLEALDQPPAGMPEGAPYTSPLRLLTASAAVPSALAARAYDASSRGSVMAEAPVVDPLRPAEDQSMFSTAIAQRGGGRGAQAAGFLADMLTPDATDLLTGGIPIGMAAGSLKKVNTGRKLVNGLYSRLDEAAQMVPAKGVPATAVMNWLKKAPEGISLEEASWRKLPEWLESQGTKTVTPEMLAAHLKANPAPFPKVKTLGGAPSKRVSIRDKNGINLGYYDTRDDAERAFRKMAAAGTLDGKYILAAPTPTRPKFDNPRYQVPGGENYRETLQTLPEQPPQSLPDGYSIQPLKGDNRGSFTLVGPDGSGSVLSASSAEQAHANALNVLQHRGVLSQPQNFRSSHFPDDPNLLVHTRANDRNLPGPTGPDTRSLSEIADEALERARAAGADLSDPAVHERYMDESRRRLGPRIRYGEEAQSDLFQNVAKWEKAQDELFTAYYETPDGKVVPLATGSSADEALGRMDQNWRNMPVEIQVGQGMRTDKSPYPDLPFDDTWPDLGLKQMYWEAANDPDLAGIGFTGAKTQIERWGTERLAWEAAPGGGFKVSFEPQVGGNAAEGIDDMGAEALRRGLIKNSTEVVHSLDDLKRLVGNADVKAEKAWKRMNAQPEGGLYQPRAEGMTHFYNEKTGKDGGELANRAAKIVKPFGGTVEAGTVPTPATPKGNAARRQELIRALQENDPNGVYSDVDNIQEFGQVATISDLEAMAREQGILDGLSTSKSSIDDVPSWLSRLTPEMKAAMRQRGFPLMSVAAPAAAMGIPDDPNSDWDEAARIALMGGSMAALGAVAKQSALLRGPAWEKAVAFYKQANEGLAERHVPRMAVSLRRAGINIPAKSAAEKVAAHKIVNEALDLAHAPAGPVEGPFAKAAAAGVRGDTPAQSGGSRLAVMAGPAVAAQGIPDDPNSETDDYARLALNMGSMAALGMAAKGMTSRGGAPGVVQRLGGEQSLAKLASEGRVDGRTLSHLELAPASTDAMGNTLVSTRVPGGRDAVASSGPLSTGLEEVQRNPELLDKLAAKIRKYPQVTAKEASRSSGAIVEAFIDTSRRNLEFLFKEMAPWRERSRQWYVGANKVSRLMAEEHGFSPDQSSAVIAILSPQKDWHQNAEMARRLIKNYREFNASDPSFTSETFNHYIKTRTKSLESTIKESLKKEGFTAEDAASLRMELQDEIRGQQSLIGRPWSELNRSDRAAFLRAHDEFVNGQSYPVLFPEGDIAMEAARTKAGKPSKMAWQSYAQIEKALGVLDDGSIENISRSLGNEHKVRSFFNNINRPEHGRLIGERGASTVDTHQVAGSLLQPMGASSPAVKYAMGGASDSALGLSGSNPLYQEALSRMAHGTEYLPREMQSITWEGLKGLFSPSQKRNADFTVRINKLWKEYKAGRLSLERVQDAVLNEAGGITAPEWSRRQ